MRFRHRPTEVDVVQWFKPGDHPAEAECKCMEAYLHTRLVIPVRNGGYADVHPGDYILTFENGAHEVLNREELDRLYEAMPWYHGVEFHHT